MAGDRRMYGRCWRAVRPAPRYHGNHPRSVLAAAALWPPGVDAGSVRREQPVAGEYALGEVGAAGNQGAHYVAGPGVEQVDGVRRGTGTVGPDREHASAVQRRRAEDAIGQARLPQHLAGCRVEPPDRAGEVRRADSGGGGGYVEELAVVGRGRDALGLTGAARALGYSPLPRQAHARHVQRVADAVLVASADK